MPDILLLFLLVVSVATLALVVVRRRRETPPRSPEQSSPGRDAFESVLLHEVDDLVRRDLAMLAGIVEQVRETAGTVTGFADAMRRRIETLSTVHGLLSETGWGGVPLGDLVTALLPEGRRGQVEVETSGNDAVIPARQATAMAMVLHELIANSTAYGALSGEQGRVLIGWQTGGRDEQGRQVLWSWREAFGPPVMSAPRPGVGTVLMRDLIRAELHGSQSLNYPQAGAFHQFTCRLEEHDARPGTVVEGKPAFSSSPATA